MAFAEDLLKQAFLLLYKEPKTPTQASLRRSVSTAYYALFHLQITAMRLSGIGSRRHPKLTNPKPLLVTGK
jgi:uncharacterized protein (UPF0332 family)